MKLQWITASAISLLSFTLISQAKPASTVTKPQPTEKKDTREQQWHNLIAGDNLSQWKTWRRGGIEKAQAWTIKDGVLNLSKSAELKRKGGSIVTLKDYVNFALSLIKGQALFFCYRFTNHGLTRFAFPQKGLNLAPFRTCFLSMCYLSFSF